MAGFDFPDIDVKSPWVFVPVGVGGLVGLVVLLRKPASPQPMTPIPVTGQQPVPQAGSSALTALSDQIAALAEQVNAQDADIADQLGAVSSGLMDVLGQAIGAEKTAREASTKAIQDQLAAVTAHASTVHSEETRSAEFQARADVGEQAIIDTARAFNVPSWTVLAFLGTHLRLPRGYAEFQQFAAQEGWFDPQSGAWQFPEVRNAAEIPVTWARRFWNWWDKYNG